jgi:4a-hydroxytetrahydrobiopterin dehydratase
MELSKQKCKPCEGGTAPLDTPLAKEHLNSIAREWKLLGDSKTIVRNFVCRDFAGAMQLVNTIAAIAEEEGHHPDILMYDYKNVRISLSTHAIGGLSLNDFIIAAKIDAIKKE